MSKNIKKALAKYSTSELILLQYRVNNKIREHRINTVFKKLVELRTNKQLINKHILYYENHLIDDIKNNIHYYIDANLNMLEILLDIED